MVPNVLLQAYLVVDLIGTPHGLLHGLRVY